MKHDLRGIATQRSFWVWDAFEVTHRPMARALGLDTQEGVYIYISGKKLPDVSEWRGGSPAYVIEPPVYCYQGMTGDPLLTRLGNFLSEPNEDEYDDEDD